MSQELKDIGAQVIYSSPTSAVAWYTQLTVTEWMAIVLGVLQVAYLIRKWIREETEWGLRMKRWAEKHGFVRTQPSDLE